MPRLRAYAVLYVYAMLVAPHLSARKRAWAHKQALPSWMHETWNVVQRVCTLVTQRRCKARGNH